MTTSSGIVGINLAEPVAFDAPKLSTCEESNQTQVAAASLKDFMYQTTTNGLGEGVRLQRSKLSQRMDKQLLGKGTRVL